MSSPSAVPSSPPITESYSITPDSGSFMQNGCFRYHLQLDTVHSKIYRYNSFYDLIQYLKTTLHIHQPYIDYPSDEILIMILTATQLNHVEDSTSNTLVNLSVPCLEYLSQLFDTFENPSTFDSSEKQSIYDEEVSSLYDRLFTLFSFLKPSSQQRRPRRRRVNPTVNHNNAAQTFVVDESILDYSMEENMHAVDNELRRDKITSLFEINTNSDKFNSADTFFGIKYLHETEKDFWKYVDFAFKTACRLTDIERVDTYECYNETWVRWREFLFIVLRFMDLELKRSDDVSYSLFALNLLQLGGYSDPYKASQDQYMDSLIIFIDRVFTNSKSNYEFKPIIPTDLTLSQKYNFSCNPSMIEYKYKGSGIGLDTLRLRSKFLSTCWKYVSRLPIGTESKNKFCGRVAQQLLNLKPKELMDFFFNTTLSGEVNDDIHFIVSFEVMRLINRRWTMTADNFVDDMSLYLKQLKTLFDSCVLKYDSNKNSSQGPDDSILITRESFNDDLEKCFIIARYQLQITLNAFPLSDDEWLQLNGITFDFGDRIICMGDIARRLSVAT